MGVRFEGRVALLTNFLPPYRIKVLELVEESVGELRVFVSVRMEANRSWAADWGRLRVTVQRTWSVAARAVQPGRFKDDREIHVPWDTVPQLWRYRPDVVIAAEFGMRTLQAAVYKCLRPRTKLIVWATISEITERYRGPLRVMLRKMILRITDVVLVNGSSGARYIEGLGYARGKIQIVPQATENELFAGPATRVYGRARRLLYAGQMIERKGLGPFHEQLVRWCEAHPEREVVWALVGTGPLREAILGWERPGNYGLELLEEVPFRELAEQYHRAEIFVLPTLADEWGLVVNEAMIAGLPVLGSGYSQAVEDLVTDGVEGWTFRPDGSEEMFEALSRALECGEGELDAMRGRAIERVRGIDAAYMRDLIVGAVVRAGR